MPHDPTTRAYEAKASRYDRSLKRFGLFAKMGFDLAGWRAEAIAALGLTPGQHVVDIACGTGDAFAALQAGVGPTGQITAVDLSPAMLDQARARVAQSGWTNVALIEASATDWHPPAGTDAFHSAFTMILVPEAGQAMREIIDTLKPGTRVAVIDMAWPVWMPLWWRHVLFFLRSYGVSRATLEARRWDDVQAAMHDTLEGVTLKHYWMGFFYLCAGQVPDRGHAT